MENIVISVIIPTHKPQNYLLECLDSLYNQTLNKDLFEIIIILNGDREPYCTLIEEIVNKSPLSMVLLYSALSGVSNARNIGIENARGNYICFIDDDDIISTNYLESLLNVVSSKEDVIVVSNVFTFHIKIDEKGEDYLTNAFFEDNKDSLFHRRSFLSTACCKIIPKKIIGDYRFNGKFKNGEDSLFMFLLSSNIRNIVKAGSETVYYRRIRKASASRKKRYFFERLKNAISLLIAYTKIYLNKPFDYDSKLFLSRLVAVVINFNRKK